MVKISLTALNIDNKVVFAHNVGRKDGTFRCAFCHSDMVLRKGEVKTHHFAHKKYSNCPYATGETMEHELGVCVLCCQSPGFGSRGAITLPEFNLVLDRDRTTGKFGCYSC